MKPVAWALLTLIAACTPPPATPCQQVVVMVAPPPVVSAPPIRPAAEVAVVRHFDRAKVKELGVVFSEGITREQIEAIHAADHDARAALTLLGKHPAQAALDAARSAVQSLEGALEPLP
jgi:hypothetical protein